MIIWTFLNTNFKVSVLNSLYTWFSKKLQEICIRKQVITIWRKHSDGVPNILIHNAKILSKKDCDATLGKPNKSFVAFSDNILTLFVRTLKIPVEYLRHIIDNHLAR